MGLSDQLGVLADAIVASNGDKRIVATLKLPSNLKAMIGMALIAISDADFKRHSLKFAHLAKTMLSHSDIVEALDSP